MDQPQQSPLGIVFDIARQHPFWTVDIRRDVHEARAVVVTFHVWLDKQTQHLARRPAYSTEHYATQLTLVDGENRAFLLDQLQQTEERICVVTGEDLLDWSQYERGTA